MGEPYFKAKDIILKNKVEVFASFDLEMIQPSLLDKTTTGFRLILGLNNLSQET